MPGKRWSVLLPDLSHVLDIISYRNKYLPHVNIYQYLFNITLKKIYVFLSLYVYVFLSVYVSIKIYFCIEILHQIIFIKIKTKFSYSLFLESQSFVLKLLTNKK